MFRISPFDFVSPFENHITNLFLYHHLFITIWPLPVIIVSLKFPFSWYNLNCSLKAGFGSARGLECLIALKISKKLISKNWFQKTVFLCSSLYERFLYFLKCLFLSILNESVSFKMKSCVAILHNGSHRC